MVDVTATKTEGNEMFKIILGTSFAIAMLSTSVLALAQEGTLDGFFPTKNFNYTHLPGADQEVNRTNAASGSSDGYLFIAGSAFTPRTSVQTMSYPGAGCTYSNAALTTSLNLPDGASILGVRLFYYSTSASSKVSMFLTSYGGQGTTTDRLTGSTTSGGGYTSEYFSAPTPLLVDNYMTSTVLSSTMAVGTEFCGMRVFYSL